SRFDSSGIAGAGEYALVTIALRDSERKRRDYAFRVQAIAHEIKTPLTAIQGSSEMIVEELVPEEQKAEMAGLIHKESKRLTEIIHTFLDVERMAAGTLNIRRQPASLEELCGDVLERARLYAVRKNITIESEVPALTLEADADLLSFALYNLLTNAVKYSPRNTTVRLCASCEGGTVRISVTDQGHGITPEEQNKIFERFYRMKRDQKGEEEGSGIGLALVKEIVAQHGGRILVESKPGEGSRFTMLLPKGAS
ncbi:MAG: ATP-binding protein, partial [Acidobacteria bacterium]|nr:ATP-binding protein [Acidobacteriota bacterium]